MMVARDRRSPAIRLALLAVVTAILAGAVAAAPPVARLAGIGAAVGLAGVAALLTMRRAGWWRTWLAVLALAAFGPFLDIVTHYPINWLIGFVILFLAGVLCLRVVLHQPRAPVAAVPGPLRLPVLGACLLLYVLYLGLQALRPDVTTINALLEIRAPLIGLGAYVLTAYWVRADGNRSRQLGLIKQLLAVFVCVGLIVAAYGLFQAAVGYNRLQAWGLTEAGGFYFQNQRNLNGGTVIFRIFSTMRRNEILGVFLYLNIVLCVAAIQLRVRPRWLALASLILSFIALLLALSLTSLVMLGLWIGSWFLFSTRSRRWVVRGIVMATFGLGAVLVVNQVLGGLIAVRFAEHVLDTQQGVGRVQMAENWVAEMGDRSPLQGMLGSGLCLGVDDATLGRLQGVLDTFGLQVGVTRVCGWQREIHDDWYATHSLEIGWLGLLSIWAVFAALAIYILPRLRRRWPEPQRGVWTILALGVLMFWPAGFVGDLIVYMPIAAYFWSLVGLLEAGAMAPAT